jgi:leader peptidase (prepilin peptidase) / N-methyltransferase
MTWLWAAAAFVFGAVFGSFANVVIYRVPKGLSIVRPPSACPSCGKPIAWFDNLPVVSYLALRGRCRNCGERIGPRYLVVELANAALWVAVTIRIGLHPQLAAFLAFATVLVILSAIDLQTRRLPNAVLGPAAAIAVVLFSAAAAVSGDWGALGRAAIGSLAYALPLFLIAVIVPAGMGMGDVKFAAYLGLHLGWLGLGQVGVGAFAGFLIGAVGGVVLIATGQKGRKDPVPFGPSMAAGALAAFFVGGPVVQAWLGLLS